MKMALILSAASMKIIEKSAKSIRNPIDYFATQKCTILRYNLTANFIHHCFIDLILCLLFYPNRKYITEES